MFATVVTLLLALVTLLLFIYFWLGMAPPNRNANGQNNWQQLKSEISVKTTKVTKITDGAVKLSKNAKKNARRRKEFEEAIRTAVTTKSTTTIKSTSTTATSRFISEVCAIDCEYVGVGFNGAEDHLARVSIVNEKGGTIYDKYVKPRETIVDYRTHVSGIREGHLVNGAAFSQVQQEVHKLLANKIVVGHAVHNDFRLLAEKLLGISIQQGEHDSLVDARTALRLYILHRKSWDNTVKQVKRK
ncbi:RNA exonuclease 4 [Aphelenchoides besseyi]|nr:RNA exonuclease 4 [Aphelenchoides besseyi]KAI6231786.1 RNA exonuclease 4 [Aphelenchoides besseyi]